MAIFVIALVIPPIGKAKARGERSKCVENLKQLNLGFSLLVNADSAPATILSLSNSVCDPKVFICPSDRSRLNVTTWEELKDKRSSYVCEACVMGPLRSMPLEQPQSVVFRCNIHNTVALADGSIHLGPMPQR